MDLENLSLVEGLRREAIEAKLKEAGIKYYAIAKDKNRGQDPFFRSCYISIIQPHYINIQNHLAEKAKLVDWQKIIEILGQPDLYRRSSCHYYAKYELLPNFDVTKLNGKLTFNHGFLVESTSIIDFIEESPLQPRLKFVNGMWQMVK